MKSVTAAWADHIKCVTARQGAELVVRQMKKFYGIMRLLDDQGEWSTPGVAAIANELLPDHLTLADIDDFIEDIRRANDQNHYLMDFITALKNEPLGKVIESLKRSENSVIPEIIGFALVLQNLTTAFHHDTGLAEEVVNHWETEAEKVGFRSQQELTFRLKFESVYKLVRISHRHIRSGEVPPDFGNSDMPLNILQATAYDLFRGHLGNSRTGFTLSRYLPGNEQDPGTGAGPVHLADGGKLIETGFPLCEDWVDLYQSWNMAFGSQFNSFPLYLCKLVIPAVAAYHDAPQKFTWDRVNALIAYLYFAGFATCDRKKGKVVDSAYFRDDWSVFAKTGLHKLWGTVNSKNAIDYKAKVKSARTR